MPTCATPEQSETAPPVLLVDYENIQDLGLLKKLLPSDFEVRVFVGANQAKIPTEVVKQAQKFGSRLTWIQIDGHGKNALDFHIAYTIGLLVAGNKTRRIAVLSHDGGFDPLLRYLEKRGTPCRRITALDDLTPGRTIEPVVPDPQAATAPSEAVPANGANGRPVTLTEVLLFINGHPAKNLPKTPKTLAAHLASHFKKQAVKTDFAALVDELAKIGKIEISGNRLKYFNRKSP